MWPITPSEGCVWKRSSSSTVHVCLYLMSFAVFTRSLLCKVDTFSSVTSLFWVSSNPSWLKNMRFLLQIFTTTPPRTGSIPGLVWRTQQRFSSFEKCLIWISKSCSDWSLRQVLSWCLCQLFSCVLFPSLKNQQFWIQFLPPLTSFLFFFNH